MNLTKKITQIFSLIFLSLFLASCKEGCVEADEFDVDTTTIESNPKRDGIYGTYDSVDGGQRADWHDTGLKSNGEKFLILISGAWTPWNGDSASDEAMNQLARCNVCSKTESSPNCICNVGQAPAPEKGADGNPLPIDCSSTDDDYALQNNPDKCTCTKDPKYGSALDPEVYHFQINSLDKNEMPKMADLQEPCKYDRGLGAYIGLFGGRGVEVPRRAYHLFSQSEICNVVRNNGKCIDANGRDITRYSYTSPNNVIFVKDNSDSGNVIYHGPNEVVKVMIYDNYYSDNYGNYNVIFVKGVGNTKDPGLLENLVSTVEETLLGKINKNGVREDSGLIKFMYKSIVQDSVFIRVVQISLSLYIAVFGMATLFGVAEMSKKEIYSRIVKIGLIIFFTSSNSWNMYRDIVVSFFTDGMNYVVAGIMDLSDSKADKTSLIEIAKMDRDSNLSNATRFSYVDITIKKLLSDGTAKKVFGLFFGNYYGVVLIPLIYVMIGFYIYVMLYVASIYLINLIKIIFGLSLGPIFICFVMFKNTQQMFKNWLAFLGARSLEIIFLFLILYNFLIMIDQHFTTLLSYRVCSRIYDLTLFSVRILKSEVDRSFIDWVASSMVIAGLLFIMKLVVDKASSVSGALISIDGAEGKNESKIAGGMLAPVISMAQSIASQGFKAASYGGIAAIKGATIAGRGLLKASGAAGAWNKAGEAVGFRGLRTRVRDGIIDAQIDKFAKEAKGKGLSAADSDKYVRQKTVEAIQNQMTMRKSDPKISSNAPGKLALAGVNLASVAKRLDQKLIRDPMQQMIKEEAKKLGTASGVPMRKSERRKAIAENVQKKMAERLAAAGQDPRKATEHLGKMQRMVGKQAHEGSYEAMGTSQAAKLFARNPEEQSKYLEYLKGQEIKRHQAKETSRTSSDWKIERGLTRLGNMLGRGYHNIVRDVEHNPKMALENFARKTRIREEGRTNKGFFNPLSRLNLIDKGMNRFANFTGRSDSRVTPVKQLAQDVARPATLKYLSKATSEKQDLSGVRSEKQKERIRKREDKNAEYLQRKLKAEATKDLKRNLDEIDKSQKFTFGGRNVRMTPDDAKRDRERIVEKTSAELVSAMQQASQGKLKDGDMTLFERAARLDYVCDRLGVDASSMKQEICGVVAASYGAGTDRSFVAIVAESVEKGIAEKVEKIEARVASAEERIAQSDKALEEKLKDPATTPEQATQAREADAKEKEAAGKEIESAKKEMADQKLEQQANGGLFATDFKVEFGASATDALLTKGPDIGLKAGSILLGGPSSKDADNSSLKNSLQTGKHQAESLAKITGLNKKLKEHEIAELEKKDPTGNADKIAKLKLEVADLERDLKKFDSEVARIDTEVKALE